MKRRFSILFIIIIFGLMLFFPKPVFQGASTGLLLWFQVVMPTLLPFIIISNLMVNTSAAAAVSRLTGPLMCRIFCVSGYGSFAVLIGFLCGYPMGSKVTADLLQKGLVSREEACYLLSFCNNTSPMFIISFVIWQNLKNEALTLPAVSILVLSPILCSFLFRRYYRIDRASLSTDRYTPKVAASGTLVDDCIMNGFETITKVGGYIMLFSVLLSLAELLPIKHPLLLLAGLPSLEITNGIGMICTQNAAPGLSFILALALTSFGGWCSIAQTRCMIQDTGLPILPYIIQKLVTAMVTSLLAYAYILL